jgi:hypothetical protein
VKDEEIVFEIAPQFFLRRRTAGPIEQIHRLREARPRRQKRIRRQAVERGYTTCVMRIPAVNEGDKRAGVAQSHKRPERPFASR